MNQATQAARKYGDADGYDAYMGGWSAALAPLFLGFADGNPPGAILDIGCGTGNLLCAAATAYPSARLVGIDPSARLLQRARSRPELERAEFVLGVAERLPFEDGGFDRCLSLLVLQEFPDPLRTLAEMRRATRPGGIVAGCQWDFARMPVIDALVAAIGAVAPDAAKRLGAQRVLADEDEFRRYWTDAGLLEVAAARIPVVREFRDFDELWRPLLAGSTPSTMTLASLPPDEREAIRQRLAERFCVRTEEAFAVTAEALVVRGFV